MVSYDLQRSMVSYQIALDQRDLQLTSKFKRAMDRHCQELVSTLDATAFTKLI